MSHLAGTLIISLFGARNVPPMNSNGKCDCLIDIKCGKNKLKSKVVSSLNPTFNERFSFKYSSSDGHCHMQLYDEGFMSNTLVGELFLDVNGFVNIERREWFPLVTRCGKPPGELDMMVTFQCPGAPPSQRPAAPPAQTPAPAPAPVAVAPPPVPAPAAATVTVAPAVVVSQVQQPPQPQQFAHGTIVPQQISGPPPQYVVQPGVVVGTIPQQPMMQQQQPMMMQQQPMMMQQQPMMMQQQTMMMQPQAMMMQPQPMMMQQQPMMMQQQPMMMQQPMMQMQPQMGMGVSMDGMQINMPGVSVNFGTQPQGMGMYGGGMGGMPYGY